MQPPVDVELTNGSPPAVDELTTSIVSASGDQCPSCGSQMAGDQRYCLECGERRGEPRMSFMDGRSHRVPPAAPPKPPKRSGLHMTSSATLIAGVATLLLAMGTGVLIGRSGNHSNGSNAGTKIIQVGGGSAATGTGTTGATAATAAAAAGGAKKAHGGKASKSTGGGSGGGGSSKATGKLPPAQVKVGGSCPKGTAGCDKKTGKFTGNFFGN